MAVELAPQSPVHFGAPECESLKTAPQDDPRWNTESPDIAQPLCEGSYRLLWPAITWRVTIPNDHIFDAVAIASDKGHCGQSVYDQLPRLKTLNSWKGCEMDETTAVVQFRTITATDVTTIQDAFNRATCNAFNYTHCFKKQGYWGGAGWASL